jgi:glycosyltransferase involved in cell wall biosynthesis
MKVVSLQPHVLCVGGEDHRLRIPFMLALKRHGFRVTAAASDDPAPFAQAEIDYRVFEFDRFINPLIDRSAIGTLRAMIADLRPDLVQSFDTKPNLLTPFAARGVCGMAVVRTINGMGWVYSSKSPVALSLRPVQRTLHRRAARYVTATVFQNREDQAFFERHHMVDDGYSYLIPGSGVDIARFENALAAGPSPAQLRPTVAPGATEVVLTVTRLTRQKGIPTLLKAAALVHCVRPGARFLLVGPRQSEGRLAVAEAEIRRHAPYVFALGQRTDVPSLLRLADVFVFPTEYREGVPRALLEAALAGLPIVATSMPGCNDVINNGWNGLLVRPHSPRALAAGILRLLDDRQTAQTMGRRAAELVRREFGLTLTVARYCRLYSELLGRAPCSVDAPPKSCVPAARCWIDEVGRASTEPHRA